MFKNTLKKRIIKIEERQNWQETVNDQIVKTLKAYDKDIKRLEELINHIPLIKQYQKTLDILQKSIKTE